MDPRVKFKTLDRFVFILFQWYEEHQKQWQKKATAEIKLSSTTATSTKLTTTKRQSNNQGKSINNDTTINLALP